MFVFDLVRLYFDMMKYMITLGLDLLLSFTSLIKPNLQTNLPQIPNTLLQDFQKTIDQLQLNLPKIPNVLIDDVQTKINQIQDNLSKVPNIPVDLLESVTNNATNLQKTYEAFEKRITEVMATLENMPKNGGELVIKDLVVNQD